MKRGATQAIKHKETSFCELLSPRLFRRIAPPTRALAPPPQHQSLSLYTDTLALMRSELKSLELFDPIAWELIGFWSEQSSFRS